MRALCSRGAAMGLCQDTSWQYSSLRHVGRAVPGPLEHARPQCPPVQKLPGSPLQPLQGARGNPLPAQSDPNQILPLSNTRFRLRSCRSSA